MEASGDKDKRRLSVKVCQTGRICSRRGGAQVIIDLFFKIENGICNAIIRQISNCYKVVTNTGGGYHE